MSRPRNHGVITLKDGGRLQLARLIFCDSPSIAFYILFKGRPYGVLGHFVKH